jgi:hypothetical protein
LSNVAVAVALSLPLVTARPMVIWLAMAEVQLQCTATTPVEAR